MHCNQMLPLQVTIGTNTSTQYDLLVCEKPTCSYQTHFKFHMAASFSLRGVEGLEENVNLNAFKLNWAAALPPSQALTSADLTLCSNIDESAIEDLPIRGRALGPLLMNSPPCVEKKAASPVCLWSTFPCPQALGALRRVPEETALPPIFSLLTLEWGPAGDQSAEK